jgi:hypothetical protein
MRNYNFKFSFEDEYSDTYITTHIFCKFVFKYNKIPYDMTLELELNLSQRHCIKSTAFLILTTDFYRNLHSAFVINNEYNLINKVFSNFIETQPNQDSLANLFVKNKNLLAILQREFKRQLVFYKGI